MTIPKIETQHNQIDGGALAFSSAPRLFTIYVSYFNVIGVKTGVLHLDMTNLTHEVMLISYMDEL